MKQDGGGSRAVRGTISKGIISGSVSNRRQVKKMNVIIICYRRVKEIMHLLILSAMLEMIPLITPI